MFRSLLYTLLFCLLPTYTTLHFRENFFFFTPLHLYDDDDDVASTTYDKTLNST